MTNTPKLTTLERELLEGISANSRPDLGCPHTAFMDDIITTGPIRHTNERYDAAAYLQHMGLITIDNGRGNAHVYNMTLTAAGLAALE